MATAQNETRGANLIAAIQVARALLGEAVVEHAITAALTPTIGPHAENRLVSLTWYPVKLYADFLQALVDSVPGRGLRDMETLGHDLVARDFAGPYGIIAKVFSPGMLVSWGPRAFSRYYRGGEVTVVSVDPTRSETRFAGWTAFNAPMWQTVRGGIRAAISACGKPVTVTLRQMGEGAAVCDITWKG